MEGPQGRQTGGVRRGAGLRVRLRICRITRACPFASPLLGSAMAPLFIPSVWDGVSYPIVGAQ